eukprot:TRINITY_DN775903_c0_g1_i1.p1 TRINITY_DN775903_c0_g1~~TRINITY_DN775903_c0_g1_i1.p1  ORF type:complete len:321 (+),score=114.23 TRINITY_DN775903_c0_g1_i1:24-965(+)
MSTELNKDALKKQIEFYFSDSNLPFDKFLRNLHEKNEGHFIPIEILCKFNKVKAFTTDVAVIAAVLEDSTEIEVSEDKTMMRRRTELPIKDVTIPRSIYFKGVPVTATLAEIEAFFGAIGEVRCIRRRQYRNKNFKTSLFVEFKDEEEVKKILETPLKWTGEEADLEMMTKTAFLEEKEKEQRERKKQEKPAEEKKNFIKNPLSVVRITEFGTEAVNFGLLKDTFGAFGPIAFAEDGETECFVRFVKSEDAKTCVETYKEKEIKLNDVVPTITVLEGKDELAYWQKVGESSRRAGAKRANRRGGPRQKRPRRN